MSKRKIDARAAISTASNVPSSTASVDSPPSNGLDPSKRCNPTYRSTTSLHWEDIFHEESALSDSLLPLLDRSLGVASSQTADSTEESTGTLKRVISFSDLNRELNDPTTNGSSKPNSNLVFSSCCDSASNGHSVPCNPFSPSSTLNAPASSACSNGALSPPPPPLLVQRTHSSSTDKNASGRVTSPKVRPKTAPPPPPILPAVTDEGTSSSCIAASSLCVPRQQNAPVSVALASQSPSKSMLPSPLFQKPPRRAHSHGHAKKPSMSGSGLLELESVLAADAASGSEQLSSDLLGEFESLLHSYGFKSRTASVDVTPAASRSPLVMSAFESTGTLTRRSGSGAECSPRKSSRAASKLQHIVHELFGTEQQYVRDLESLVEGYLMPARRSTRPSFPEPLLLEIFSNLEELLGFHRLLLDSLDSCFKNLPVCASVDQNANRVARLAQVFIEHGDRFNVYGVYCTNFPRAVSLLSELRNAYQRQKRASTGTLRRTSSAVAGKQEDVELASQYEFITAQQKRVGHSLPLASHLLKPVQRILKYHLLLEGVQVAFRESLRASGSFESGVPIGPNADRETGETTGAGATAVAKGNQKTSDAVLQPQPQPSAMQLLERAHETMRAVSAAVNEQRRADDQRARTRLIYSLLQQSHQSALNEANKPCDTQQPSENPLDGAAAGLPRGRQQQAFLFGELLLEDTLRVYGSRAPRNVFLFERALVVSKPVQRARAGDSSPLAVLPGEEDPRGAFVVKQIVLADRLVLVECLPDDPLAFSVRAADKPRSQLTLQASSAEQKRRWCIQLKLLVVEHFSARLPPRAKQLLLADLLGTGSPPLSSATPVVSSLLPDLAAQRPEPRPDAVADADGLVSNGFATVARRPKPSKSKSLVPEHSDKRSTMQLLQWAFSSRRAKRGVERLESGSVMGGAPRIEHVTAPERSQSSENLAHAASELQAASAAAAAGDGVFDLTAMLAECERLHSLPMPMPIAGDQQRFASVVADEQSSSAEEAQWATRMKPNRRGIPVFEFELDADSLVDVALEVNRERLSTDAPPAAKPPPYSRQSSTHSSSANPVILYITPSSSASSAAASSARLTRLSPPPQPPNQTQTPLQTVPVAPVAHAQTLEFEQMLKPLERVARSVPPKLEQDMREAADTASEHSSCVRTECGDNGGDSPPTPRAIVSRIAIQQMLLPRAASSASNSTAASDRGVRHDSPLAFSNSLDLCAEMGAQIAYCRPPTSSTSMSFQDADESDEVAVEEDTRSEMSLSQRPQSTESSSGLRTCAVTQLKTYEHSRSETDLLTRIALSHDCLPTSATTALHAIELGDPLSSSSSQTHTQTQTPSPAHTEASFAHCGAHASPSVSGHPARRNGLFSSLRNLFRATSRERRVPLHSDSSASNERTPTPFSKLTLPPSLKSADKCMTFGTFNKSCLSSQQQQQQQQMLAVGGVKGCCDKTSSSRARARLRMAPVHCSASLKTGTLAFGQLLTAAAARVSPHSSSASNSCHSSPLHASFAPNAAAAAPAASASAFPLEERAERVNPMKKLFALLLGQRRRRTRNSSCSREQDDSPDPFAEARASSNVYCTLRKQKKNGNHRAMSVESPAPAHRRQLGTGAAKATLTERRGSTELGGVQHSESDSKEDGGHSLSSAVALPDEAMCMSVLALDVARPEQLLKPQRQAAPPLRTAPKPARGLLFARTNASNRATPSRDEPIPFADSEGSPCQEPSH